jgi:catechol 2,3-dioxygenase-like lactoylglutathione lyase family enzyme
MRLWSLGVVACLLLAAPVSAQPAMPEASAKAPTDFRRITFIVKDMDRSLSIWRDILGFKVNYDTMITVSGVALPAGKPGNKTRLVILEANDKWIGGIGLLQFTDPPLPARKDGGKADSYPKRLGIGGHVVVLNTDDVDGRCAKLQSIPGVTITMLPSTTEYPGRDGGPPIRVRGCNFFDPDGTFVEMNQLLNRSEAGR